MSRPICLIPSIRDDMEEPSCPTTALKMLRWHNPGHITSPSFPSEWVNLEIVAQCGTNQLVGSELAHHFRNCSCGIYAVFYAEGLHSYASDDTFGAVIEPFGTVIEAHCGIKSTHAHIVAILARGSGVRGNSRIDPQMVADHLELPLVTLSEWYETSGALRWVEWNRSDLGRLVAQIRRHWEDMIRSIEDTESDEYTRKVLAKTYREFFFTLKKHNGQRTLIKPEMTVPPPDFEHWEATEDFMLRYNNQRGWLR